ncbi:MAG: TlpA family protein disulfide reductase [Chitinophagales bacterium]|nr:TlpA family protein disulfide reductase [Chitinophagales bacterium]
MNRYFRVFSPAFLLLGSWQCSTQNIPALEGRIQPAEGWKPMVYLIQPRQFAEVASSYSGLVLDSAQIAPDGSFRFEKAPAATGLLQLCVQKNGSRFSNQLLDEIPLKANYMPLVWTGKGHLYIQSRADAFQSAYNIQQPDPENQAIMLLRDLRHQVWQQESITLEAVHDEHNLMDFDAALRRFQTPLIQFSDTTAYWRAAMLAVRWTSAEGDYERLPECIIRQCNRWQNHPEAGPWFKMLCDKRASLPVSIGETTPDHALPMAAGDTLQLKQLLGKKLTILDIWASWCAPCRKENREVLQPLWAAHQSSGLQIIGYSIDSSPAAWKAAISKDGANWPQASHLSGDDTPFMQTLRISTIPANFILDAQGKVLAKNLHGEALSRFIAEYLQK